MISFSCTSLAATSFGGNTAGSAFSSGLMYCAAARFGLPEPIRFVRSAELRPSSMKLMNRCARSGRGALLWITMLSTASTAPSFGMPCRMRNGRPAACASWFAWKMSFE